MRFAVSNIGLPAYDHAGMLPHLAEMGLTGLEVAPSRVWRDSWHGLSASRVTSYRRAVEAAGLRVVGLHSLFFDQPALGLFKGTEIRARTADFLIHLSALCRDLGGRSLIFGSAPARRRGALPVADADALTVAFFRDLAPWIESHGTCFCFEPLGAEESDYINSLLHAKALVEAVGSPALRLQIDAKAMASAGEIRAEIFAAAAAYLVHVHASEPGLGVIGSSGAVDHAAIGRFLRGMSYDGFVSIEQRQLREDDPLADIAASFRTLRDAYGGPDP